MKNLLFLLLLFAAGLCHGQMTIEDEAIRYQQERMVFKQWDEDKFVPKPGFLGLNPLYWITWGLHPNYPDNDLRPLSIFGPQTQRLALSLALSNTDNAYKKESDTVSNTALSEVVNYSPAFSSIDPLWMIYYSREFAPILQKQDAEILSGLAESTQNFLIRSGMLSWYLQETDALKQRIETAKSTTLDRGSRIVAYQRMLEEYRKLESTWSAAKQRSKIYLDLSSAKKKINQSGALLSAPRTDKQIAEDILKKSKL